ALPGIGVELQVMPQASKPSLGQLVITDRTAKMRANIAEGPDHLVPTEHEDIMIADPTGELTGGFQLGDVADFDKTGRGVGMREVVGCRRRAVDRHLRASQLGGYCEAIRSRLAQHDPHSVEKIDGQSYLTQR